MTRPAAQKFSQAGCESESHAESLRQRAAQCFNDRSSLRADDRDPWHPSAAGWHPRSPASQLGSSMSSPVVGNCWKPCGIDGMVENSKKTLKKKRPLPVMIERTSTSDGRTHRNLHRSRPVNAFNC